jgi:uncharacterized protein (DUF849 family)
VPVLVKACINGFRPRKHHRALPLTPQELAREAAGAVAAGAGAIHAHVRTEAGEDTLEPDRVGAAVRAIREACPSTPLGLTTGLWTVGGDHARRMELIAAWEELPDFASVNMAEDGFEELCELLLERGVGLEPGLWSEDNARTFAASRFRDRVLRVLVEAMDDDPQAALKQAAAMEDALREGRVAASQLHHGAGQATWAVIDRAIERGYDVRVGLEDTTVMPDGSTAKDNAELVAEAVRRAAAAA